MRKYNPKYADVENLFGYPLIHLAPVRRDSHHRGYLRCQGCAFDDLASIKHELQSSSETGKVERTVFHFENHAIES